MGLYLNPPDKAIVLSVDEKSQIQALDPANPAASARLTADPVWSENSIPAFLRQFLDRTEAAYEAPFA